MLQELLGMPALLGRPMAELWMGAHPKAPSSVWIDGRWESLERLIQIDPEGLLGKFVARKYQNTLPFLFKVLGAEKPLSVQVHPNLKQARAGFLRENKKEIPIDSPNRNYRDDNHKPELLCALGPFHGLKGFREIGELIDLMSRIVPSGHPDLLQPLRKRPDTDGLRRFFLSLVGMERSRREQVAKEAAKLAEMQAGKGDAFDWAAKLHHTYPGDIGALFPVILNLVKLEAGEAIYIAPGELHAYLQGVGVEIMANSDNVLRGALTSKHTDVQELVKVIDFKAGSVPVIRPEPCHGCVKTYVTPAQEFSLSVISLDQGSSYLSPRDRGVEIMVCLAGEAGIKDLGSGEQLKLLRGRSLIVPSSVTQYLVKGKTTLYQASVPGSSSNDLRSSNCSTLGL